MAASTFTRLQDLIAYEAARGGTVGPSTPGVALYCHDVEYRRYGRHEAHGASVLALSEDDGAAELLRHGYLVDAVAYRLRTVAVWDGEQWRHRKAHGPAVACGALVEVAA